MGALGGLLAAGLSHRLGPAADQAGALLVHGHGGPSVARGEIAHLGSALEGALLPVFAVLLLLAAVNVAVASSFPRRVDDDSASPAATGAVDAATAT